MAQSISVDLDLKDLQEIDRCFQQREVLQALEAEKDKTISELGNSLALSQKELDLEKRENQINQKIIAVKDMEIQANKNAFDQMKDVSDRALKLAETSSKSSSNWWYFIPIAGIIGYLIAVL